MDSRQKTIEGWLSCREGKFQRSFRVEIKDDITPETIKEAFKSIGVDIAVTLRIFDKEYGRDPIQRENSR